MQRSRSGRRRWICGYQENTLPESVDDIQYQATEGVQRGGQTPRRQPQAHGEGTLPARRNQNQQAAAGRQHHRDGRWNSAQRDNNRALTSFLLLLAKTLFEDEKIRRVHLNRLYNAPSPILSKFLLIQKKYNLCWIIVILQLYSRVVEFENRKYVYGNIYDFNSCIIRKPRRYQTHLRPYYLWRTDYSLQEVQKKHLVYILTKHLYKLFS